MEKNKYEKMTSEEKFKAIGMISNELFHMTGEPVAHNLRENARYALKYLENQDASEK